MNTKEKIIQTALKLFNEQGVDGVTVRHIANEMGISHGNLCYHFPNKDAIVIQLYDQLVTQLNQRLSMDSFVADTSLHSIIDSARVSIATLAEYQFLMLDFAGIMRQIPVLRDKHRVLVIRRKASFRERIGQLRNDGLLKDELYPGHDDDLLEQFFIVGDFWLSSATILYDGASEDKIQHYQRVFLALFLPLLTDKGLSTWRLATNDQTTSQSKT